MRLASIVKPVAMGALLVACGSSRVPAQRLASSEASVRAAQEVGAQKHPDSALHLRLAQEQLDTAKKLINDGDTERAEYMLLRAKSDAELALSLAREKQQQAQAHQAIERVRELSDQQQQNMPRTQPGSQPGGGVPETPGSRPDGM